MKIIFDQLNRKNNIGKEILKTIQKGVKSAIIISPYISDLEKTIDITHIDNMKIICNAESNSCNPFTLYKLYQSNKVQIKSRKDIHAKIYIFDNTAFITSANATPNGLGTGSIEAATKIKNKDLIEEIYSWFTILWNDKKSEDISNYSAEKWQILKSNWKLNKVRKKKTLYDLIVTKKIPKHTSFCFWYDDDTPKKSDVEKQAKKEKILELPDNNDHWDFYVEEYNYPEKNDNFDLMSDILNKYYDDTIINLKTHKNTRKVYRVDSFFSKFLPKPIILKHGVNNALLTLYRTDNIECNFKIDQKSIKLINSSKTKNPKEWKNYLASDEGSYGFCKSEQLYKMVKGCI